MMFSRLSWLPTFGAAVVVVACADGGPAPPGPPSQIAKTGGDGQSGYFNNPLPMPYSVTVRDANNRTVPGVSVDWSKTLGGGTLSADRSTTNASGVATTLHTLGTATRYVVTATVTSVPASVTFTADASAPPSAATERDPQRSGRRIWSLSLLRATTIRRWPPARRSSLMSRTWPSITRLLASMSTGSKRPAPSPRSSKP
jgi:hypothetical protein